MDVDFVPLAIGAVVGLGQGLLGQTTIPTNHHHAFTIYRCAAIAAGAYGEMFAHWNPDISYGLMTSGIALLAERVPAAAKTGSGAFGYVAEAPMLGSHRSTPRGGAGSAAPGCSSCGGGASRTYAALGSTSSNRQSAGGIA